MKRVNDNGKMHLSRPGMRLMAIVLPVVFSAADCLAGEAALGSEGFFSLTGTSVMLLLLSLFLIGVCFNNRKKKREREMADEEHRENLLRLRTMVRNAPVVLFAIDRHGVFTLSEGKGLAAMGFSPGEIVGRSAFEVYQHEPDCLENFHRALAGECFTVPYRVGGHVFDIYHEPVFGEDGAYAGTMGVIVDVTERARAEESLRQANLVVENGPAVLFRWSASEGWPVEMVSNNVTRFGFSPDELLSGRAPFSSMVHPDDVEHVTSEVAEHTRSGEDHFRQEYRIVTRDGDVRWIDDYTVVNRDAEGSVTSYQGILVDITERKRTENVMSARMRLLQFAQTHTLEELLQATLDEAESLTGSSIGFYHYLEADQKTLSLQNWSTRTKREFCKAEGEVLHYDVSKAGVWVDCIRLRRPVIHNDYTSLPHRKGLPPGHAPVIRELVIPVFRGDTIVAVFGVGNKTGDYTSQDVETLSLLTDLAWGIADRMRAERALRESEEKFRVLAETSSAAIALYQGEEVIYANPTASRLIGYPVEELSSTSFWNYAHEDFREMLRERGLARMQGEPTPSQYECKFVTKDGRELWSIVSVGRIEYKGKPAGIVTLIDTTESKLAEEQVRSSLAEKEVLLKEIHHRVKNNLQIVSSLLDLQSDFMAGNASRLFLRDTQDRIKSMALIHQKLYQSDSLAFIDLREYVQELADSLYSSSVNDPDLISLEVDSEEILLGMDEAVPCGLIVNELISNSLKHAFPEGMAGDVSIRCRIDDGRVVITVSDNGVGLPTGLDVTNAETLGLQLVCMLTEQLRGTLSMDGEQGGASVKISFPGALIS